MRRLLVLAALAACVSGASWKVLKPNLEPVLLGISFLDGQTGFMAGGQDGEPGVGGAQVYKTSDGGNNWDYLPHGQSALMFLDIAMQSKTSGVVGGLGIVSNGGIEYTTDGMKFTNASDFEFEQECQSAEIIRGTSSGFALTGMFSKTDGAAISVNGGVSWKKVDAKLNTTARYGSFPSLNTWYIAAGEWPESKLHRRPGVKQLTERLSVEQALRTEANGKQTLKHRVHKRLNGQPKRNGAYSAALAKTADGGRTWTTQFYDTDFYFNAISCPTENSCWVVGEADDGDKPGCRILHTGNGGQTWEVQMYNSTRTFSLIGINMIDENSGWACGGELDTHFRGHFWYTNNGGRTWTLNTLPGVYGATMSFVGNAQSYVGWATAFTLEDSAVLAYN